MSTLKHCFFSFIFTIILSVVSQAAEEKELISWYQPELITTENTSLAVVILSGKTNKNNSIRLLYDKIFLLNEKNEVFSPPPKDEKTPDLIKVDKTGNFELKLVLPMATAQIPFSVKSENAAEEIFQLNFQIKANKIIVNQVSPLLKKPKLKIYNWQVKAGLGINYFAYKQNTTIPSDLSFQSVSSPSLYTELNYSPSYNTKYLATYTIIPAKSSSPGSFFITNEHYSWKIMSFEMFRYLNKDSVASTKALYWGPRVGIQYHEAPFLSRANGSNNKTFTFLISKTTIVGVGAQFEVPLNENFQIESFVEYQYITSPNLYSLTKQMAFNGSFALNYELTKKCFVELAWYGQQQDFSFAKHQDALAEIQGSQTLLFSNIEARIGYNF